MRLALIKHLSIKDLPWRGISVPLRAKVNRFHCFLCSILLGLQPLLHCHQLWSSTQEQVQCKLNGHSHLAKSSSQVLFTFPWTPSLSLWQPILVQTGRMAWLQWNRHAHRCTTCTPARQVSFTCTAVTSSWHTRAVQGWGKRVSHKLFGQLFQIALKVICYL